ncbi:hypothetical protein Bca101_052973 [Brassica carinata]
MSQLLSSPLMAASCNPLTIPRFLSSSSSALVAGGGLAVKRQGLASKPVRTVNLSVKSRQTDYFEKQRFGDSSSSQNGEGAPARFYVGHSIYKGKAALTVEPRAPEFVSLDVFSLSVSEIGTLVSLGPRESCEFFHDPNKGKSIYIPITRAEFTVLVSAFNGRMSTPARKRLMRDFKRLQQDPPAGISGAPQDNNIMLWNAVIFGPDDTPWDGGTFKLSLQFSEDYPNKPPTVRFVSRMFHPNIYADGSICLDILQNQWSPIYDVAAILTSIQSLLCDPNPNSPANSEAARMYSESKREYNRRVRDVVEQSWTAD